MRKFMMKMAMTCIFALALGAMADIDAREYRLDISGTNTVSKTYTVRGELTAVHVVPAASDNGQVTVASDEITAFNKSGISEETTFLPRIGVHGTNGVATNVLDKVPLSGPVTVTVAANSAKAANKVWFVRLLYKR